MINQVIKQHIPITVKAYKKHGLWGRTVRMLKHSFISKGTHSLFEPITQMVKLFDNSFQSYELHHFDLNLHKYLNNWWCV